MTDTRNKLSPTDSVAPLDPMVMAGVAGLLLVVVALANYLPSRRATQIDPMQALHHE